MVNILDELLHYDITIITTISSMTYDLSDGSIMLNRTSSTKILLTALSLLCASVFPFQTVNSVFVGTRVMIVGVVSSMTMFSQFQ